MAYGSGREYMDQSGGDGNQDQGPSLEEYDEGGGIPGFKTRGSVRKKAMMLSLSLWGAIGKAPVLVLVLGSLSQLWLVSKNLGRSNFFRRAS